MYKPLSDSFKMTEPNKLMYKQAAIMAAAAVGRLKRALAVAGTIGDRQLQEALTDSIRKSQEAVCGHQRTREDLELSLYKGCPACRYRKGENMATKGRISKKYIVVETLCWQVEADNMEEAREKIALSREKVGKLCSRDFDVRAQIGREMEKFLSEVIDNDN